MSRANVVRLVLVIVIVAVLALAFVKFDVRQQFGGWFEGSFRPWLHEHTVAAPFVYVLLYVVATVAFLPGSIITLAGGAIFGVLWGTVLVSAGSTMGATAAFLVARYFASDWVEKKATGMMARLKHGVEREGWKYVAITRLIPVFPFNLLNYAFGMTRIRIWHYVLASWLCMLPATVAYVYTGSVARDVAAGGGKATSLALEVGLALAALVVVSIAIPKLVGRWRGGEPPAENTSQAESR